MDVLATIKHVVEMLEEDQNTRQRGASCLDTPISELEAIIRHLEQSSTNELAFVFLSDIGGSPVIIDHSTESEPEDKLSGDWSAWWRKLTVENFNSTKAMQVRRFNDSACDIRTFIARHRTLVHHNLKAVV